MIKKGNIKPIDYSDDLFNLIKAMMHQDAEKRPSMRDLMNHPKIA